MEATLIMLDKPILVNEELTKEQAQITPHYQTYDKRFLKSIAGHEGTKRLTFQLSDEDAKRIGYVDVEKLAFEKYPILMLYTLDFPRVRYDANEVERKAFIKGAETYASLTPKKYTVEQARAFFDAGTIFGCNPDSENNDTKEFESIKSKLDQPPQFKVECTETENEITITKIL